jgi:nitrile hydratase subunit beta
VDGIHDLGGMHGFGPVEIEPDEPFFHEPWERRGAGLVFASFASGHISGGRYRHAVERMDPAWYLASPYYERMVTGVTTVLAEVGAIERAQLDDALGAPFPLARPDATPRLTDPGPSVETPRWAVGDAVRVRDLHPSGHTRCPRYVRGRRGTVVRIDGVAPNLDVEAHCDTGRLEPTYSVRFEAQELWGAAGDPVHVDLWESHLEDDDG